MTKLLVLIDDDTAARRMMRRILERRGYAVEDASNGLDGLKLIQKVKPNGVLLDLRMPGELSGLDVAHKLREDASTQNIPIIVVSASTHLDAKSLVIEAGCDAFVEKPVDFEQLENALKQLVG